MNLVASSSIRNLNDYTWRDLTTEELKAWYTPTDLCVAENTIFNSFPQDVRSKNCSQFSRGATRMHCGVGMGANNKPCYGPFGPARPSFKRGVKGFTDANKKPLVELFTQLHSTNTSLVIVGDSTMRQKLQALECEVLREHPGVRTRGDQFGILPCDTTMHLSFPNGLSATVFAVSMGPNSVKCLKGGRHGDAPAGSEPFTPSLSILTLLLERSDAGGIFENVQSIVRRITHPDCGAGSGVSSSVATEKVCG